MCKLSTPCVRCNNSHTPCSFKVILRRALIFEARLIRYAKAEASPNANRYTTHFISPCNPINFQCRNKCVLTAMPALVTACLKANFFDQPPYCEQLNGRHFFSLCFSSNLSSLVRCCLAVVAVAVYLLCAAAYMVTICTFNCDKLKSLIVL